MANRKKILFVTERFPYPPTDGVRGRVYNLIRYLGPRHNVHLVSFHELQEQVTLERIAALERLGCRVAGIHSVPRTGPLRMDRLANLFERTPYSFRRYRSKSFEQSLMLLLRSLDLDVVHLDMINMAQYRQAIGESPCVISINDAVSRLYEGRASSERGLARLFLRMQAARFARYEASALAEFTKCVVVSEFEKQCLKDLNRDLDIHVVPLGVDLNYWRPSSVRREAQRCGLLFTGSWGGKGNTDPIVRFFVDAYPQLVKEVPGISAMIVGQGADKDNGLARIKEKLPRVSIVGYVPDIRPYYDRADVCVCYVSPYVTGVQTRVLEAMAMAKPVVTNSDRVGRGVGAGVEAGLVVAEGRDSFIESIRRLANDMEYQKGLGTAARRFIEEHYGWRKMGERIEQVYEAATEKVRRLPGPRGRVDEASGAMGALRRGSLLSAP